MSTYNFFQSCLATTKQKYLDLVNTPGARAGKLNNELKETLKMIETALAYDEITVDEANYFITEFKRFDFSNLTQARMANKEREKYNVGNRYYR